MASKTLIICLGLNVGKEQTGGQKGLNKFHYNYLIIDDMQYKDKSKLDNDLREFVILILTKSVPFILCKNSSKIVSIFSTLEFTDGNLSILGDNDEWKMESNESLYTRRELNPKPSASEADTLSN